MSEKERDRDKAGLHKKISSIFSGVLIPQKNSGHKSSGTSTPEDIESAESQQKTPEASKLESQNAQILLEAEPVQKSRPEPPQEEKNKAVFPPNFVTAREEKVIPIQESETESPNDSEAEPALETSVEPVQESKAEQTKAPKFATAQESKVVPVHESEVEPAQELEDKSAPQRKSKSTEKPKFIAVQRLQKADIEHSAKKNSPVVKVADTSSWKQITSKLFEAKPGASTTKQKTMVVMVPVLFIILVIFVFKGGVLGTSIPSAQSSEDNNNVVVTSGDLNDQINWEIPEPYPTTLRDPMRLAPVVTVINQAETKELAQLAVKSILYSEDNSSVIISNRIVHEGDQIQGASIAKINKDNVEFEMNGEKWSQPIQR